LHLVTLARLDTSVKASLKRRRFGVVDVTTSYHDEASGPSGDFLIFRLCVRCAVESASAAMAAHTEAPFVAALQSLAGASGGSKESIRGCSELLLQAPAVHGPLLLARATELDAAGSFVALQRLVYVLNDALFALHASGSAQRALVVRLLEPVLALAASCGDKAERAKLLALVAFWEGKGAVDAGDVQALRGAAAAPPRDARCPVGCIPELVRRANKGVMGAYEPIRREDVLAAPVTARLDAAYLQTRMQRLYDDLSGRASEPQHQPSHAVEDSRERRVDTQTNTFADGSAAGVLGARHGVGQGSDADGFSSFRKARSEQYYNMIIGGR